MFGFLKKRDSKKVVVAIDGEKFEGRGCFCIFPGEDGPTVIVKGQHSRYDMMGIMKAARYFYESRVSKEDREVMEVLFNGMTTVEKGVGSYEKTRF